MISPILLYAILGALVVLVVILAVQGSRGRRPRTTSQEAYVEALKELIAGNDEKAYGKLQEAVRAGTAPTDAYIKLGRLLRERGDASKALQIHQSLTVKTDLTRDEKVVLFQNLAADYARMGNSAKSVQVLETATRNLNIRDPEVYMLLAKHYHLIGEYERSFGALREAKKLGRVGDRELALYLVSVAERTLEKGERREAKKQLHRCLKHDPDCAPGLLLLGDISEQDGDVDEAIDRWKQVAVLSPPLAEAALNRLERTLYEKGRFSDVENIYDHIRASRQGDEASSLALAAFYRKQGRGRDAIELLEEFTTVYPESVRGSLLLTALYAKFGEMDTLEKFLDRSIEDSWQSDRYYCQRCELRSDSMRWHCPRCNAFDSFSANHAM